MNTSYIPIIDISALYSDEPQQWHSVANEVDQACQQSGFLLRYRPLYQP